jgi:hypothetical protein
LRNERRLTSAEAPRTRSHATGEDDRFSGHEQIELSERPIKVDIYSRPACHLCDEAKDVVERVQKRLRLTLTSSTSRRIRTGSARTEILLC